MKLAALEALPAQGLQPAGNARLPWRERAVVSVGRAQKFVLGVGAFMLPLVFIPNAADSFIMAKLLVARSLLIVLTVLWLIRAGLTGSLSVRRTPLDILLAAFVGSAALSTTLSINQNLSLFGAPIRYEGLWTILVYAGLFWLTVQTLHRAEDARGVLRILLAAGYAAALFAIVESLLVSVGGVGSGESAFTFGGLARADGTLGNPNLLATLLAMLLPLALAEFLEAGTRSLRLCWLNLLLTMALALVLTFSRAAWIGGALGLAMVATGKGRTLTRPRVALAGLAGVALLVLALAAAGERGGVPLGRSIVSRAVSIANATSGSGNTRLHIWRDTVHLIQSRPIVGYGPDTYGLVFPRFQSGNWTPGYRNDKAHADTLQVASSQGLVGLALYAGLLITTLTFFWRARRNAWALPFFAAWLGYEVPTQLNFSWLPASAPFWIVLALAMVVLDDDPPRLFPALQMSYRGARAAPAALALTLLALLVPAVVFPYVAGQRFSQGLIAELHGDTGAARSAVLQARRLSPENSAYALEEANLDLRSADIVAARTAYQDAVRLGTSDPAAYRSLATVDQLTGRFEEAVQAARQAVQLDPFDPANRDVLNQLTQR